MDYDHHILYHLKNPPCNEMMAIATLALVSQPRQRLTKVRAKIEAWELHFMFPGV
jgi:hypothetical protein